MAIKLDEDNKVVVYENEPEEARSMFPNIQEGGGSGEDGVQDVLINGVSIVDDSGDANIPRIGYGNTWGAASLGASANSGGIALDSDGAIYIAQATEAYIQGGVQRYRPITPNMQHLSVFYGLSKVAGVDLSGETITPGQYTDEAKIAIQKMLGIYEAPWELINSGNFTNESEADYTINTDSNGQPLELTDIRLIFWLPAQQDAAAKGNLGRVECHYSDTQNHSGTSVFYFGAWSQASGASGRGAFGSVEQKNNMVDTWYTKNNILGADVNIVGQFRTTTPPVMFEFSEVQRVYDSIVITAVTGRGDYILYGKRK